MIIAVIKLNPRQDVPETTAATQTHTWSNFTATAVSLQGRPGSHLLSLFHADSQWNTLWNKHTANEQERLPSPRIFLDMRRQEVAWAEQTWCTVFLSLVLTCISVHHYVLYNKVLHHHHIFSFKCVVYLLYTGRILKTDPPLNHHLLWRVLFGQCLWW